MPSPFDELPPYPGPPPSIFETLTNRLSREVDMYVYRSALNDQIMFGLKVYFTLDGSVFYAHPREVPLLFRRAANELMSLTMDKLKKAGDIVEQEMPRL